jgi:hypothetical protein
MSRCALVPRSHHVFLSSSNRNWWSNLPVSRFFHGTCHPLVSLVGKRALGQGFAVSDAAGGATGWTRQLLLRPRHVAATMEQLPAVFRGRSYFFSSSSKRQPRKGSHPRRRSPRRSYDRSRTERKSPGGGEPTGTVVEPWSGQPNHTSAKSSQMTVVEQVRAKQLADHAAALERIECLAALWTRPTTPASKHPMVKEAWSRMTIQSISTLPTPRDK